jgi:tetratricopeptide (TPR) repeat protein
VKQPAKAAPTKAIPVAARKISWLFVLFAAALAVKLAVLWQLHAHPLLQADAGLDTTTYAQLAARVAGGDVLLGPQTYFVSPLYVYFMGAILWATGSFTAVRVAQTVLGACAVLLVFATARAWFSERAAWCAAILCAAAGIFTFDEVLLIQAALDPFLIAASLAALTRALMTGRPRWFAVAGLCFGVAALNRPNVLAAAAAIALSLVALHWRRSAIFALGAAIALTPAAIRNGTVAGDWSPLPSQGGLNFYIGNNPGADGTYRPVPGIRPSIEGQQVDAREAASRAAGHPVSDRAASAYFFHRGFEWIAASPAKASALYLQKLRYLLGGAHIFLNYSYPFFAYDARTLLAALPIGAWLLIPLGLVGLARRLSGRARWQFAVWASFVPVYALVTAAFFTADRYRMPLLIPMAVCAGGLLDSMAASFSAWESARRGTLVASLSAVAVLLFALNWPAHLDDGRPEERARMAERMIQLGRYDEGEVWAAKAEAGYPRPAVLEVRIGRQFMQAHRWEEARQQFARAAELEPAEPEVQYRLGQALLESGRPGEAVGHLRSATAAAPNLPLAGYHLARALAATGNRSAALAALQTAVPLPDATAQNLTAFGELAIQLQAPQLAEAFLRRATAADPRSATAHAQLGVVLGMSNRLHSAEDELRGAVRLDSTDAATHLNLAVVLAEEGRTQDARQEALAAVRLRPDYPQARQLLAALPK